MHGRESRLRRTVALLVLGAAAVLASHPAPAVGASVNCTITGTAGTDRLRGTATRDVICARGGADRIFGLAGSDRIYGGGGRDRIIAGAGNDVAVGNRRGDRLVGGPGTDRLFGGFGTDLCRGGLGTDRRRSCELPNHPPSAADDFAETYERTALTLAVLGNDTDVDNDALAIRSLKASATTGAVGVAGGRRAVTYDPTGRFVALGAGETATDRFSYAVGDPRGGTDSAVVSIAVVGVDDPPSAFEDSKTLHEDAEVTSIDVLGNDADPDGGPISLASATDGGHGTVEITSAAGDLTYVPDPDYCGPDSFTYRLAPGGSEARVLVSVLCTDDPGDVSVDLAPNLFPAFSRDITDYVVRCSAEPLAVSVDAKPGASVSVDGGSPQTGEFTQPVALESGQAFSLTSNNAGVTRNYHVRCLPPDFPAWNFERLTQPQEEWYLLTPALGRNLVGSPRYVVFFDGHGVPVWWHDAGNTPLDAKLLSDGTIAWASYHGGGGYGTSSEASYELHRLNGDLLRTVRTVGTPTDFHDLQESGNGNLLLMSYKRRDHVDLTAHGGSSDSSVLDAELQEIDPEGNVVWTWNSSDHIRLEETGRWWSLGVRSSNDVVHINSVEPDGDSLVISLRHTDAVYKIDRTTGAVQWKLGGTTTPESLTVIGDPHGAYPLGGQHDARVLADGSIAVYDNATALGRPPRAVRYEIDEVARTATLVESVTDPEAPASPCCGSARRSDSGSWLVAWGGTTLVSEFDPAGDRTFRLSFPDNRFTYRAFPVAPGRISRAEMRAAMEAMHPR